MARNSSNYFNNHNGTKPPTMIFILMGLNILVYALHVANMKNAPWAEAVKEKLQKAPPLLSSLSEATLETMTLVPGDFYRAPREKWPTIVGSMFTHANLAHLLFNMAALYKFGRPLEHALGPLRVLLIYMASGLGTNLIYAVGNRKSQVGIVGASAAISGISAAYFLEYADRRSMRTWLMFQITGALLAQGSGVSFVSHLIGFAIGALVYTLLQLFQK